MDRYPRRNLRRDHGEGMEQGRSILWSKLRGCRHHRFRRLDHAASVLHSTGDVFFITRYHLTQVFWWDSRTRDSSAL